VAKLLKPFYTGDDVVLIAQALLGKKLLTQINGVITSGYITETEAYRGWGDKACHASMGKKTERNKIMYEDGGRAYVYLCYGIHHLFNIVTNSKDNADAVLIRAIEPAEGVAVMLKRRNMKEPKYNLTSGPGSLSKAMGISINHSGQALIGDTIWLEDDGRDVPTKQIIKSPRVGVAYAGADAKLPWRFRIKGSKWLSPAK